jgi:membrane protein implicated in regulation of membrane protease activity
MLTLVALVVAVLFLPSPWNVVLVATAAIVDTVETGVLVWWSRRRRRLSPASVGAAAIIGHTGITLARLGPGSRDATSPDAGSPGPVGQVRVDGEIWSARSTEPIDPGVAVTVRSVDGLVLGVEPARSE